jgi:hypothetical protein
MLMGATALSTDIRIREDLLRHLGIGQWRSRLTGRQHDVP